VSALSSDVRALRRLPAARHWAFPDGRSRVLMPGVFHFVRHVRTRPKTPDGNARAELLPVHAVQRSVPDKIIAQSAFQHEPRQRTPHVPVQQLHWLVSTVVPDGNRVHRSFTQHPLLREITTTGPS